MVGKKERERAFLENGSRLLEELIVSCNGRPPPIRSFSIEELRRATNNYDRCRMFHRDGIFKWYSGSFEGRMVSIKKFEQGVASQKSDFLVFTDIAICSKMSAHNNVLKLVGCCLESPIPISVYESATNETLASAIRVSSHQQQRQSITWQSRLKIAKDIAHTISYLHVAFSRPIVHRNLKSASIFLDQNDVAKLSDFSLSIGIPEDQDHVEDGVRGTIGSICPYYLSTGYITEKTDTFGFGVFLLELLTGQRPFDLERLSNYEYVFLIDLVKNHAANEIVDPALLVGGGAGMEQQLEAVLRLALICTKRNPERRPTMTDVTKELIQIERFVFSHFLRPNSFAPHSFRGAGMEQQLEAVLQLALICIKRDLERRPTMTDVTKELIRIERSVFSHLLRPNSFAPHSFRGAGMEQQLEAVLRLALICIRCDPERRLTMTDVTKELIPIERSIFSHLLHPNSFVIIKYLIWITLWQSLVSSYS